MVAAKPWPNVPLKQVSPGQGVPVVAQWTRIRLGTMRSPVRSLALLSRLRIWPCRELWCRSQTQRDPVLLRLWCGVPAVVLIRPLAWEAPYAAGRALQRREKKKKNHRQPLLEGKKQLALGLNKDQAHFNPVILLIGLQIQGSVAINLDS